MTGNAEALNTLVLGLSQRTGIVGADGNTHSRNEAEDCEVEKLIVPLASAPADSENCCDGDTPVITA